MKLLSGSLLVTLVSTTAWAAAPTAPAPAPAPAAAQAAPGVSAERIDLARRYVALGNSDDFMQGMRAVMMRSANRVENADDKAQAEKFFERVFVLAGPKIQARMPAVLEAQAQAYAREFSAAELKDMIAFVGTPTGRHYLARGAAVESDPAILDAQMGVWEDLTPIMEQVGNDMAKDACAKKAAARVAMGDKKATCPLAKAAETRAG
jgi:hypothetical protein